MKKEEVNNISKELLACIPELKKGEVAVYELLGGVNYNVIGSDNKPSVARVFPAIQKIINRAVIFDKGQDANIKIGYVISPGTKERDPRFGKIEFKSAAGSRIMVSDSKKERELYHFLELHPENQDNVNPDKSVPLGGYVFRRVKPEATAAEKLAESDKKLQAAAVLRQLTEDERRELARQFGLNSSVSEAEITLGIDELIRKDIRVAKTVTNLEFNTALKTNVLLEDAQKLKLIGYNAGEQHWAWGESNEKILGGFSGEPTESLKQWMASSDAGEKFHDKLKKEVASAHSKKGGKK